MGRARTEEHGLTMYRRGCGCEVCRRANRDRMREYRANKRREAAAVDVETEQIVEQARELDPLAPAPALDLTAAPGRIERALRKDLRDLTGAPPWKRTLSAVARLNARVLDQAPTISRLDLVSPLELRLIEQLKMLRGVSVGGSSIAADAEQLLKDMAGEN